MLDKEVYSEDRVEYLQECAFLLTVLLEMMDNHVHLPIKLFAISIYCRLKLMNCEMLISKQAGTLLRKVINSCIHSLEIDYTKEMLQVIDLNAAWNLGLFYYNYDRMYYWVEMPLIDIERNLFDLECLMTEVALEVPE